MTSQDRKHLFVLGYADRAAAEAAVAELKEVQQDKYLELRDYAIISKAVGGEVTITESRDADPGAQRGALAGGLAGALVGLVSAPIGLGALAVGAGVGAVTAAVRDSGFKTKDLGEVGRLMQDGRTILLVAVRPEDTDRLRETLDDMPELKAADARWEADVSAESKNVLADALALWYQQEAQHIDEL